jgi:hypothetical protein
MVNVAQWPADVWSRIEEHIGIIAACIPCLRGPFQHALKWLRFMTTIKSALHGSNITERKTTDSKPHQLVTMDKGVETDGVEKAGFERVSDEMAFQV